MDMSEVVWRKIRTNIVILEMDGAWCVEMLEVPNLRWMDIEHQV